MGLFRKVASASTMGLIDSRSDHERDDALLDEQLRAPAPETSPGHKHEFTDVQDIEHHGEPAYLLRCDCGYLMTLPRAA